MNALKQIVPALVVIVPVVLYSVHVGVPFMAIILGMMAVIYSARVMFREYLQHKEPQRHRQFRDG